MYTNLSPILFLILITLMVIGSYTVADQCTYHKQFLQGHTFKLMGTVINRWVSITSVCLPLYEELLADVPGQALRWRWASLARVEE